MAYLCQPGRSMMANLFPAEGYTTNLLALTVGLQRVPFERIVGVSIVGTRIILNPRHSDYHYDIKRIDDELIITGYRKTPSFWDDVRHAFGYGYAPLFKIVINTDSGGVTSQFLHKDMRPFELRVLVDIRPRRIIT